VNRDLWIFINFGMPILMLFHVCSIKSVIFNVSHVTNFWGMIHLYQYAGLLLLLLKRNTLTIQINIVENSSLRNLLPNWSIVFFFWGWFLLSRISSRWDYLFFHTMFQLIFVFILIEISLCKNIYWCIYNYESRYYCKQNCRTNWTK
jgi:hypothetical protein